MKLITTQQSLNVSGGQDDDFGQFLVDIIKIVFNITDTNSTNYNYGYSNTTYYPNSGYGNYNYTHNHNFTNFNSSYY